MEMTTMNEMLSSMTFLGQIGGLALDDADSFQLV